MPVTVWNTVKNVQRIPTEPHSKSLGIFDVSLEIPSDSIGFMGDSVSVFFRHMTTRLNF